MLSAVGLAACTPGGGVRAAGSCGHEPAGGAAACPAPLACLRLPSRPGNLLTHSPAPGRGGRTPASKKIAVWRELLCSDGCLWVISARQESGKQGMHACKLNVE